MTGVGGGPVGKVGDVHRLARAVLEDHQAPAAERFVVLVGREHEGRRARGGAKRPAAQAQGQGEQAAQGPAGAPAGRHPGQRVGAGQWGRCGRSAVAGRRHGGICRQPVPKYQRFDSAT